MRKSFLFLLGFLISPAFVFAETYWGGELPNISDIRLKAGISVAGDVYTYSYAITSGTSNTGQIWFFDIDVKQPEGGVELSGEGLVNGRGYAQHSSALILSEPTTPKMIPVGLWSPHDWNSGLSVTGKAGWGSNDAKYRIFPGQSLNGFRIDTHGLPGLRNFKIEPKLVPPSIEDFKGIIPDIPDITEDESVALANKKFEEVENMVVFTGKTLGPTAPPADFKPITFIDYIISLKHEAVTLGWIKNEGIVNSLDVKLENAKKAIEKNNIRPAKNMLEAFINEVEAQGCASYDKCPEGKHLTPEAYGLLKYNAEYLLGKL